MIKRIRRDTVKSDDHRDLLDKIKQDVKKVSPENANKDDKENSLEYILFRGNNA